MATRSKILTVFQARQQQHNEVHRAPSESPEACPCTAMPVTNVPLPGASVGFATRCTRPFQQKEISLQQLNDKK